MKTYTLVGSMKIDKARILDILSDTSGAPMILKMRIPAILSALSGQASAGAHFNIDSMVIRPLAQAAQHKVVRKL